MAIRKKLPKRNPNAPAGLSTDVTVPSFSYPATDELAQVVLDAWTDGPFQSGGVNVQHLGKALLDREQSGPNKGQPTQLALDTAKERLKGAKLDLVRPVVISEAEHDDDYIMQDPTEVVFVLPDPGRKVTGGAHLLETAKLLMACTPNGI